MWSSAIVAAFHYLALAIGLPAVFLRGRALKGPLDEAGLRRLFAADNAWGIAALFWVATGLLRVFGGFEKGRAFYLSNPTFHLKLGLFVLVLILEVWPMMTFLRWRRALKAGRTVDSRARPILARINHVELVLVVLIVFVATMLARGLP
jgi:putative membrane protein